MNKTQDGVLTGSNTLVAIQTRWINETKYRKILYYYRINVWHLMYHDMGSWYVSSAAHIITYNATRVSYDIDTNAA